MVNLDVAELRSKIDLDDKYVDFGMLRTALSVEKIVRDLNVKLTESTKEGECRAACPKCGKERSFALNVNANRFNCFNKGCFLKGGGVIDFFAKLYEVPAKEASHLLACAYGIQPYGSDEPVIVSADKAKSNGQKAMPKKPEMKEPVKSGEVSCAEFDALEKRVERLSVIIWSQLFENGEVDETPEMFDGQPDYELKQTVPN